MDCSIVHLDNFFKKINYYLKIMLRKVEKYLSVLILNKVKNPQPLKIEGLSFTIYPSKTCDFGVSRPLLIN